FWLGTGRRHWMVIVLGGCLGPARLDEFGDDAVERRRTFDRRPAVVAELDPALVEAVEHLDPKRSLRRGPAPGKGPVERHDPVVVEGQDLGEERAGDV